MMIERHKMKISHELPLSLMNKGYEWNDYDYLLPIFLDRYEQYKLYFQKARKDNRFIIMDNSLFEGYTHTTEDLLEKINLIKPNIFIVPDVWNNTAITLKNAKEWIKNYKQDGVEFMAVLQGETFGELKTCYKELVKLGYTHIAFNHSSIAYQTLTINNSTLSKQMLGRWYLINSLEESGVLDKDNYHHLLGCSLPQEIKLYKHKYEFLNSIDTSNPILLGAEGVRYEDGGIDWKPTEKLEHYFEKDLDNRLEDIIFNVNKFKEWISYNEVR